MRRLTKLNSRNAEVVPMSETRRSFLRQSAATMAAAAAAGCAPDGGRGANEGSRSAAPPGSSPAPESSAAPLPATTLRAVAEAALPGELGEDGRERAVAAFERWSEGLEPVAELAHPYLVPETRYSGPDPRPGWAAQLRGLDKECRARHGVDLGGLDVSARRNLLARAVQETGSGLGAPANAHHVAVALMAHFFASPTATDLCHGRVIAKQQCRGLGGAQSEPPELAGAAPGPGARAVPAPPGDRSAALGGAP